MQITVHLRSDVARELAERSPPTAATKELQQTISRFGLTLQPLHPGTDDPDLRAQFWLEVAEQVTANQVIQALLQLKATEGAYCKPPDALP